MWWLRMVQNQVVVATLGMLAACGSAVQASILTNHATALPVSFGPSSAPHVVAIAKVLHGLQGNPTKMESVWNQEVKGDAYLAAQENFLTQVNRRQVVFGDVEALVEAWLLHNTNREHAAQFVSAVLNEGLPVLGQRDRSKVIGARQAKKWIKAAKKVRDAYSTVAQYQKDMISLTFDVLPRVMKNLSTADLTVAYKNLSKQESSTMELIRYVGYHLCRETSPPTFLADYSNALTGWQYGETEERMLTALHYPIFAEQLEVLRSEHVENPRNDLLGVQIQLYQQYLAAREKEYEDFKEKLLKINGKLLTKGDLEVPNVSHVIVGGAGRVSAEVSRDLSKFHNVWTHAVDHRQDFEHQAFNTDGTLKSAYCDFLKELAKDTSHLPTFEDRATETHYRQNWFKLSQSQGVDKQALANLERILRANLADDSSSDAQELQLRVPPEGEGSLKLAPNFLLRLGEKGMGDVVYATPKHYVGREEGEIDYVPATMDDKVVENLESMMRHILGDATTFIERQSVLANEL